VLAIGVPAGIQGMVFSLSNVCIQSAINSFGSSAVAGSTIGCNFEYFSYYVVNAFGQTAVTFTSQNFGAGDAKRCKKIFRICLAGSVLIAGGMSICFGLGSHMFARIYAVDDEAIAYAVIRIVRVAALEFMTSGHEIGGASLRGMGHSMLPAMLTVLGTCVLRLVWVYTVFERYRTFVMLMNVYPVTWAVTGSMILIAYFMIRKKEFSKLA
jgi:Na+-driven multidrug efflux pump